jgi:hypothetical protein
LIDGRQKSRVARRGVLLADGEGILAIPDEKNFRIVAIKYLELFTCGDSLMVGSRQSIDPEEFLRKILEGRELTSLASKLRML